MGGRGFNLLSDFFNLSIFSGDAGISTKKITHALSSRDSLMIEVWYWTTLYLQQMHSIELDLSHMMMVWVTFIDYLFIIKNANTIQECTERYWLEPIFLKTFDSRSIILILNQYFIRYAEGPLFIKIGHY